MNKIGSRSGTMQNGPNSAQISTDTETRSVLDALKEISRKRIHTTPVSRILNIRFKLGLRYVLLKINYILSNVVVLVIL